MKLQSFLLTIFVIISISSCNTDPGYRVLDHSPHFISKNLKIDAGITNNEFRFTFKFNRNPDFPFPIMEQKDTLCWTQFIVEFFHNGKPVELEPFNRFFKNYWEKRNNSSVLSFAGPYRNIKKYNYDLSLIIPMYAFHSIPMGKQEFVIKVHQDYFYGKELPDTGKVEEYKVVKVKNSQIWGNIRLNLDVPAIYKTRFMLDSFKLVSSKGWDFTLIDKGNADPFWTISYPAETNIVYKSAWMKNTKLYNQPDTAIFYHYKPDDEVSISVIDYDWLSPDDPIETWKISLKDWQKQNGKEIILTSTNCDYFKIRPDFKGIINKR